MFAIENHDLLRLLHCLERNVRVEYLTLTFRYTDWWWWERDLPPHFESLAWIKELRIPYSVKHFTIVFQTRNGRKKDLEELIKGNVSHWRLQISKPVVSGDDDKNPSTTVEEEETPPEFMTMQSRSKKDWIGPARFGKRSYAHHAWELNESLEMEDEEMLYYQVRTNWRRESIAL